MNYRTASIGDIGLLVICLLYAVCQVTIADDLSLVPMEKVPRLPESFELADYKQVLARGTLLPDRITWDTVTIRTGLSETRLVSSLPDSVEVLESAQSRTRDQQWQFVRGILARNNFSMHYYTLCDTYYDKQLYGFFKAYEWRINGVGNLRIHLYSSAEKDGYRIWLMELELDSVSQDRVKYKESPGLVLIRSGDGAPIEWDIDRDRVIIGPRVSK